MMNFVSSIYILVFAPFTTSMGTSFYKILIAHITHKFILFVSSPDYRKQNFETRSLQKMLTGLNINVIFVFVFSNNSHRKRP